MTERNDRDNLKCIRCGKVAEINDDAWENASGWEQDVCSPGSVCPTCLHFLPEVLSDAEMARMDGRGRALWAAQPHVNWNDRETLIDWLCWNDSNGCYSDEDMIAEGFESGMTLAEAREQFNLAREENTASDEAEMRLFGTKHGVKQ